MKIELTEEEINSILSALSEIPFKYSNGLIQYLANNLNDAKKNIANQPITNNS